MKNGSKDVTPATTIRTAIILTKMSPCRSGNRISATKKSSVAASAASRWLADAGTMRSWYAKARLAIA